MPLSQDRILRWSYLRLDQSAYHGWLSMMTSSDGPPFLVLPRAPPTLNPPLTARQQSDLDTHLYPPHDNSQFIWQQHTCGSLGGSPMECEVGGQPQKTPHFHPRHRHPSPEWPSQEKSGSPPHWCRTFPLLLAQMGYDLLCGLWRKRTIRRPCCLTMSNPSTSSWTARPDGCGRWDNQMAAQHLPRDLVRPNSG